MKAALSISGVLTVLVVCISAWLGYAKFSGDWRQFQSCPNTDVLSWDANLRMLQTLDVRSDLGHGKIFRALGSLIESPTWPPLHSLIAQAVFAFTGPSTIVEAGIGFTFAILDCMLLLLLGIQVLRVNGQPVWAGALMALCCMIVLFHSPEMTAYFLSAMLESQGMFFFLLVSFAFFKLWHDGQAAKWWVLAASIGLFLTKYPYGHILIVAGAPIVLLREFHALPSLIRFLRVQYSGRSLLIPAIVVGAVVLLAFAKFLPGGLLNTKTFKYFFYGLVVSLFLDFNWKLWRSRNAATWPDSWHVGYLYCALPVLFLTFLNPDRFSSTIGTQLHEQDASRSYFLSLFSNLTDSPLPVFVWFSVLGLVVIIVVLRKGRDALNVMRRPLVMTLFLILAHILVLEFLTSNKQLRHIYHLLPALLLFSGLAMLDLARDWKPATIAVPLLLSLGSFTLLVGEKSLLRSQYYASRYVCWTGTERSLFDPVRELVARVPRNTSFVLLNRLHEEDAPLPGRQWATEFDLLLRMQSIGIIRNDSRRKKADWSEFDGALLIQADCTDPRGDEILQDRARAAGKNLRLENSYSSGAGLCLKDFRFSKTYETR